MVVKYLGHHILLWKAKAKKKIELQSPETMINPSSCHFQYVNIEIIFPNSSLVFQHGYSYITIFIGWFPKIGVPPKSSISNVDFPIFPEINHPAIGVTPIYGNPI